MKLLLPFLFFLFTGASGMAQGAFVTGGRDLPSEGRIHALFIFVRFPEDSSFRFDPLWPADGMPDRLNTWIDSLWSPAPTPFSLTDYFNVMSLNKLKFTGRSFIVSASHTRDWYLKKKKTRSDIHSEIISRLDSLVDFSEFDNWSNIAPYKNINKPDRLIDFTCFIWRNVGSDMPDSAHIIDKLGFGWFGDTGINQKVDNGQRTIRAGATLAAYFIKDPFRFTIHEFAHYLLGGNEMHNGHAFWAILSGYEVRSIMINAFERRRLGWGHIITLNKSPKTLPGVQLADFITTGSAYCIEIDSASNQYFYIENHQRISHWDRPSGAVGEKGIYVIRQDRLGAADYMSADWMRLVPAEGRFRWSVSQLTTAPYYNGYLPVYKKGRAERDSGFAETDKIIFRFKGISKPDELLFIEDSATGQPREYSGQKGHGRDAFRIGYNEVFSPWSSPNSQRADRSPTGIGFNIISETNGVYSMNIYVGQAQAAPPSKPMIPEVKVLNNHPSLFWPSNTEPDMIKNGKYKIYRAAGNGARKNFKLAAVVKHSRDKAMQNWTDINVRPGALQKRYYYKISALDNKGLESVKTEEIKITLQK